jgi:hypothetical protein
MVFATSPFKLLYKMFSLFLSNHKGWMLVLLIQAGKITLVFGVEITVAENKVLETDCK